MQAICEACRRECTAKIVDNGIGRTEWWGYVSTDIALCVESDCCSADCLDETESVISVQDLKQYEEGERDYAY